MTPFIIREVSSAERLFPKMTLSLYELADHKTKLTSEQSIAVSLLKLSSKRLNRWQKYLRWRLDPLASVTRALFMHRKAFELEQAAQFSRADFFWQELYSELERVIENDHAWSELARVLVSDKSESEALADPTKLRARFIEEILIDTHAAFFNGYIIAEPLTFDSRAWMHLDCLTKVLEWSDLSSGGKLRLVRAAIETRIGLFEAANRWDEAIQQCSLLLQYDENSFDYQEKRFNLYLGQRISHYSRNGTQFNAPDGLESLTTCIQDFEQLRAQYWRIPGIYDTLGNLYHQLAAKLAADGRISVALAAAQKAVTFNPSSTAAAAFLVELTKMMNDLKEQAKNETGNSSARINGAFLFDEVRVGFRLLEEYKQSDEASETAEAVRVARAVTLWNKIGLAEPLDRLPERACKLAEAVDSISANPPVTPNEIRDAWRRLADEDQDLAQLEHDRVFSFIEQRLCDGVVSTAESERPAGNIPTLAVVPNSSQSKQRGEPIDFWLLSRKDIRLKLQALAALILFIAVAVVVIKDTRARSIRAESYQTILQGSQNRNHLQVIEGAETFLSYPLVVTTDNREEEVVKLYSEALVLWVVRQPSAVKPETAARIERYRQLVGNHNGGRS